MTTVWLLLWQDHMRGWHVGAVFSTLAKAEEYQANVTDYATRIESHNVDIHAK